MVAGNMREACISAVGALGMKAVAHLEKPDAAEVLIAVARELITWLGSPEEFVSAVTSQGQSIRRCLCCVGTF